MCTDYPMWGKAKLTILLQRQGYSVCESTTGRLLKMLVDKGAVSPVPTLRRKARYARPRSISCRGPAPKPGRRGRAFNLLPTITLEADAATVMRLIRMPQVLVVRLPRPRGRDVRAERHRRGITLDGKGQGRTLLLHCIEVSRYPIRPFSFIHFIQLFSFIQFRRRRHIVIQRGRIHRMDFLAVFFHLRYCLG